MCICTLYPPDEISKNLVPVTKGIADAVQYSIILNQSNYIEVNYSRILDLII